MRLNPQGPHSHILMTGGSEGFFGSDILAKRDLGSWDFFGYKIWTSVGPSRQYLSGAPGAKSIWRKNLPHNYGDTDDFKWLKRNLSHFFLLLGLMRVKTNFEKFSINQKRMPYPCDEQKKKGGGYWRKCEKNVLTELLTEPISRALKKLKLTKRNLSNSITSIEKIWIISFRVTHSVILS